MKMWWSISDCSWIVIFFLNEDVSLLYVFLLLMISLLSISLSMMIRNSDELQRTEGIICKTFSLDLGQWLRILQIRNLIDSSLGLLLSQKSILFWASSGMEGKKVSKIEVERARGLKIGKWDRVINQETSQSRYFGVTFQSLSDKFTKRIGKMGWLRISNRRERVNHTVRAPRRNISVRDDKIENELVRRSRSKKDSVS